MRHKHYDCIVAWASGKKIECRRLGTDEWHEAFEPTWSTNYEYRIKKEPLVEVKYFVRDYSLRKLTFIEKEVDFEPWDLRITYQDGVAVKAEVAE